MKNLKKIVCGLIVSVPLMVSAADNTGLNLTPPKNIASTDTRQNSGSRENNTGIFKEELTEPSSFRITGAGCHGGPTQAWDRSSAEDPCRTTPGAYVPPGFVPELDNVHIRRRESKN